MEIVIVWTKCDGKEVFPVCEWHMIYQEGNIFL